VSNTLTHLLTLVTQIGDDVQERVVDQLPHDSIGARRYPLWSRITPDQRTILDRAIRAVREACTRAADAMTDADHAAIRRIWDQAYRVESMVRGYEPLIGIPAMPASAEPPPWTPPPQGWTRSSPGQRLADREHDCQYCGPSGPCDCP